MRNLTLRRVIEDCKARLGYIAASAMRRTDDGSPGKHKVQALASQFINLWQRRTELLAEDLAQH